MVDPHDPAWPVIQRMDPAVAELGLRRGQAAMDAGCGTGRALPHLRAAVGPTGHVLGFDLTPEMLATARGHGRHGHAALALADARRLPLRSGSVDGGFAAGLLPHLPDPGLGLAELARVVRPGGRLVLFHPSGRVALAAPHGRRLRTDDLLAPDRLAAGPPRRRPQSLPRRRRAPRRLAGLKRIGYEAGTLGNDYLLLRSNEGPLVFAHRRAYPMRGPGVEGGAGASA